MTALNSVIIECYRGEPWIGGLFPWSMNSKTRQCHREGSPAWIFTVAVPVGATLECCKAQVRELLGKGKHSCHSTDSNWETERVLGCFRGKGFPRFLQLGYRPLSSATRRRLKAYFDRVRGSSDYCLTGSVVVEMHGGRPARDIDYIHREDESLPIEGVGAHKSNDIRFYPASRDRLLDDPRLYVVFNGHKVLCLDTVLRMKRIRNERKDRSDLAKAPKLTFRSDLMLNPSRFDLIFKLMYLRSRLDRARHRTWKQYYLESIRAFNGFSESVDVLTPPDKQVAKTKASDFTLGFDRLLGSIRKKGFDSETPVCIGSRGMPANGAHRIATAFFLGIDPVVCEMDTEVNQSGYDYLFFLSRGMNVQVAYAGAREYLAINDRAFEIRGWKHDPQRYSDLVKKLRESNLKIYFAVPPVAMFAPLDVSQPCGNEDLVKRLLEI